MDLQNCLEQYITTNTIESFELGTEDIITEFQIPHKLYGREQQSIHLQSVFAQIHESSLRGLILVSGYSGIGKTSFVNELQKSLFIRRGYFISGKFDQLSPPTPYSAFFQAFKNLTHQLLTESEVNIKTWREEIIKALGVNAGLITAVLPEIQLIIGKQNTVIPISNANESQERFNAVLKQFVGVFAKQEHPLIIFLDDLQWADNNTLNFIKILLCAENCESLLILGGYRDNEVKEELSKLMEEVKSEENFYEVQLKELNKSDVKSLIIDTLNLKNKNYSPKSTTTTNLSDRDDELNELVELVYKKTQGNAFSVRQFLSTLYLEGLIQFNTIVRTWQWDISKIKEMNISDNVVELILHKIKKVNRKSQKFLSLSAMLGNVFYLHVVQELYSQTQTHHQKHFTVKSNEEQEVMDFGECIYELITQGFIVPVGEYKKWSCGNGREKFAFVHDRVQQAAAMMVPQEERSNIHLHCGRILYSELKKNKISNHNPNTGGVQNQNFIEVDYTKNLEDKRNISKQMNKEISKNGNEIFEIVNQFNAGMSEIESFDEKVLLAKLNWKAAKKAQKAVALEMTRNYSFIGIQIITILSLYTNSKPLNFYVQKRGKNGEDESNAESPGAVGEELTETPSFFGGGLWTDGEENHNLSYELYKLYAHSSYSIGQFDSAEKSYPILIQNSKSDLEHSEILCIRAKQFEYQVQYARALEIFGEALELLNYKLCVSEEAIAKEVYEWRDNLLKMSIPGIISPFNEQEFLNEEAKVEEDDVQKQEKNGKVNEKQFTGLTGVKKDIVNKELAKRAALLHLLPEVSDPTLIQTLNILHEILSASYFHGNFLLYCLADIKIANLTVQFGQSEAATYGLMALSQFGGWPNIPLLSDNWELISGIFYSAKQLLLNRKSSPIKVVGYVAASVVSPTSGGTNEMLEGIEKGYELGKIWGQDSGYAAYAAGYAPGLMMHCGMPLEEAEVQCSRWFKYLKVKSVTWYQQALCATQPLFALLEVNSTNTNNSIKSNLTIATNSVNLKERSEMNGQTVIEKRKEFNKNNNVNTNINNEYVKDYNDEEMKRLCKVVKLFHPVWCLKEMSMKWYFCTAFPSPSSSDSELQEWYELATESLQVSDYARTVYIEYDTKLFAVLLLSAIFPYITDSSKKETILNHIKLIKNSFNLIRPIAVENFEHKYYLVCGCESSLTPNSWKQTLQYFDLATESARNFGFTNFEAISLELAGNCARDHKLNKISIMYYRSSYSTFAGWGAKAKLKIMEKVHKNLTLLTNNVNIFDYGTKNWQTNSTSISNIQLLEVKTILKVSAAISSETTPMKFLKNMMKIMIETASAQKGLFVLVSKDTGELNIAAEVSINAATNDWVINLKNFEDPNDKTLVDENADVVEKRERNGQASSQSNKDPVMQKKKPIPQPISSPEKRIQEEKRIRQNRKRLENIAPLTMITFVKRKKETVISECAYTDINWKSDVYISTNQAKSVICIPILLPTSFTKSSSFNNLKNDNSKNETKLDKELNKDYNKQLLQINKSNSRSCSPSTLSPSSASKISHKKKPSLSATATSSTSSTNVLKTSNEHNSVYENDITPESNNNWNKGGLELKAILYLENNSVSNVFNSERAEILKLLSSQVATSLENAFLIKSQLDNAKKIAEEQTRLEEAEKHRREQESWIDMICHEIRNPLNGIYGNVEMVSDSAKKIEKLISEDNNNNKTSEPTQNTSDNNTVQKKLTEEEKANQKKINLVKQEIQENLREGIEVILECAHHQKVIADDVLNLSKLDAKKVEIVESLFCPEKVIVSAMKMFRASILKKNLDFNFVILNKISPPKKSSKNHESSQNSKNNDDGSYEWMKGDAEKLKQVIINLISNAVKFTSKGQIKIILQYFYDTSFLHCYSYLFHFHENEWAQILRTYPTFQTQFEHLKLVLSKLEEKQTSNEKVFKNEDIVKKLIKYKNKRMKLRKVRSVEIAVEDSGIGMTEQEQKNLFERFSQANSKVATQYGGTGLGLAISKGIIELMGGKIQVSSVKEIGTKFYFRIEGKELRQEEIDKILLNKKVETLNKLFELVQKYEKNDSLPPNNDPTAEELIPINSTANPNSEVIPPVEKKNKVLIVEDNIINQKILTRMLAQEGFEYGVASNGKIGLDMYKEKRTTNDEPTRWNIVLMDIEMPIMNGMESTEKIREYESQNGFFRTAIVGLSGNAREEQIQNALKSGMDSYKTKPYEKAAILKMIRELAN